MNIKFESDEEQKAFREMMFALFNFSIAYSVARLSAEDKADKLIECVEKFCETQGGSQP